MGKTTRTELLQLLGTPTRVLAPAPDLEILQYDKKAEEEVHWNVSLLYEYSAR